MELTEFPGKLASQAFPGSDNCGQEQFPEFAQIPAEGGRKAGREAKGRRAEWGENLPLGQDQTKQKFLLGWIFPGGQHWEACLLNFKSLWSPAQFLDLRAFNLCGFTVDRNFLLGSRQDRSVPSHPSSGASSRFPSALCLLLLPHWIPQPWPCMV